MAFPSPEDAASYAGLFAKLCAVSSLPGCPSASPPRDALLAVPVGTLTPKEGGTRPFLLDFAHFPGSLHSQILPRSAEQPGSEPGR